MNTVRPKPYLQRDAGNYNSNQEGADKDGRNPQGRERQQQQQQQRQVVARGRASEVTQIQPEKDAYVRTPQNYQPQQTSVTTPVPQRPIPVKQVNPLQYRSVQHNNYQAIPQPQQNVQMVPQQQMQQHTRPDNRVNIAQILKDFRNTMKAIATPADIETEVNRYLQIVEQQVNAPQPQVNLIQSNLRIAASLLDNYISATLNKESKVVQNWLDALFLQKINYSYNESEVNPNFLVKFPEEQQGPAQQQDQTEQSQLVPEQAYVSDFENNTDEIEVPRSLEEEYSVAQQKISVKPNITIIPQDTKLKSLFMEAKKQAFSNNPQKAMRIFREAFDRADEIKDSETQSRICLEIGKIYDDNDFVVQALTSYHKSLQYTTDTNVKSRAHYSMAQIYDDVNQVEPALEHYITSISYAGKNDDLVGQTESLTHVANLFSDKYDEVSAFDCYDVARKLVDQTNDDNMKGYVLSNTADACVQFRKNDKALKYYAEAVKNYEKINASEEIAENYKAAAELMIAFNSYNKAKSLLKKAMVNAVKTQNEDLIAEINLMLANVSQD